MTLGELITQIESSGVPLDTEIEYIEDMRYPDFIHFHFEPNDIIGDYVQLQETMG